MKLRILAFALFLLPKLAFPQFSFGAFSSNEEEPAQSPGTMDLIDFLEAIESDDGATYALRDTEITSDRERLKTTKYWVDSTHSVSFKTKKDITLTNCTLRFSFFDQCELKDLTLTNCKYPGSFSLRNSEIIGQVTIYSQDDDLRHIRIENWQIKGGLELSGSPRIQIYDSELYADTTRISKHLFYNSFEDFAERAYLYTSCIDLSRGTFENIHIDNCKIRSVLPDKCFSVDLNASEISKLKISNSQLESINFYDAAITKNIKLDSIRVSQFILMDNVSLPGINTNISWENLKGGLLALRPTPTVDFKKPYRAKNDEQLADLSAYNDYISTYNMLIRIYKDRGELASSNGCYTEMKDAETRRLKYLYSRDKNLSTLFN